MARPLGIVTCVDAAQTAGVLPIDVEDMAIDLLAFTGHKIALSAPRARAGSTSAKGLTPKFAPLTRGGTGSRSEFEEQPDFMPDKYEAGTPNAIGLAGLGAGAAFVLSQGTERIRAKEEALTRRFLERLDRLEGDVTVYGPLEAQKRISVVSFNVRDIPRLRRPHSSSTTISESCAGRASTVLRRPTGPSALFPGGPSGSASDFLNTEAHVDRAAEAVEGLLRR